MKFNRISIYFLFLLFFPEACKQGSAALQPDSGKGYYASTDEKSGAELKTALFKVIGIAKICRLPANDFCGRPPANIFDGIRQFRLDFPPEDDKLTITLK